MPSPLICRTSVFRGKEGPAPLLPKRLIAQAEGTMEVTLSTELESHLQPSSLSPGRHTEEETWPQLCLIPVAHLVKATTMNQTILLPSVESDPGQGGGHKSTKLLPEKKAPVAEGRHGFYSQ